MVLLLADFAFNQLLHIVRVTVSDRPAGHGADGRNNDGGELCEFDQMGVECSTLGSE